MEAQKVIEFFIDSNGVEIEDAEKNGKAVVFDNVAYREGEQITVVTNSGEVYTGLLEKVSTLKTGSNKDLKIIDSSEVGHVIKYELIRDISKVEVEEGGEDEE